MLGWFGTGPGGGQGGQGAGKYTLGALQELYAELSKNQQLSAGKQEGMVETVRAIAEVIVYGDQHTEQLFEYFCEKNMFPLLLGLLDHPNCGTALKVQIIQSVSILVQNIRSETSLYYTLSNNHVNRLIAHPFDFANEEVLGQYISFLKTLSLKLNAKTIQFFFNDCLRTFPLYEEAVKLFDHPEGMVRTAVRTITLNVFRVEDAMLYDWLLHGPSAQYIEQVVRFIHRHCRRLHLLVLSGAALHERGLPRLEGPEAASKPNRASPLSTLLLRLEVALSEQQDHLLYLEDVLSLNVPGLEQIVVDSTRAYLLLPLLLASLMPQADPFAELDDLSDKELEDCGLDKATLRGMETGPSGSLLSLFLLSQAFFWFTNPRMLNGIVEALLLPAPAQSTSSSSPPKSATAGAQSEVEEEAVAGEAQVEAEAEAEADANDCPPSDSEDSDSGEETETDGASSLLAADEGADTSSQPAASSQAPRGENPVRAAFLKSLDHADERHCLGAVTTIYAIVNNKYIDQGLLDQSGLTPRRRFRALALGDGQDQGETGGEERQGDDGGEASEAPRVASDCQGGQGAENTDPEPHENGGGPGADCSLAGPTSGAEEGPLYPREVVGALLNLLKRDPPLTTLTQRVVAKLIIDLTCAEDGAKRFLDADHAQVLNEAYLAASSRCRKHLDAEEHKRNQAQLVEMVEMEWHSLCQGPLKVESLMTEPQVLLPGSLGPTSDRERRSLPLDGRQPRTVLETTRCSIRSFMILRLLWTTVNRQGNSLLASVAPGAAGPQEGQKIDLSKCDYIKLNVLSGKGTKAPVQPAFMVLAEGALLLVEPSKSGLGRGAIRTSAPLHRTKLAQSPQDELVLHIIVRSPAGQPVGWAHRQLTPLVARTSTGAIPPEKDGELPWTSPTTGAGADSSQDPGLRDIQVWHLTLRFEDHASAYWARDQLNRTIEKSVTSKLRRIGKMVTELPVPKHE